jgi:tRNA(adenine34) deaminase
MPELKSRQHEHYMRRCMELARQALTTGDAPVGALIVLKERIVAEGIEGVKAQHDVTAHAEIEAVRNACEQLDSLDLTGSTLYTTVAPCVMCAYAIRLARISTVVTGTASSDADRALNGQTVLTSAAMLPGRPVPVVIPDVLSEECRAILRERKS